MRFYKFVNLSLQLFKMNETELVVDVRVTMTQIQAMDWLLRRY